MAAQGGAGPGGLGPGAGGGPAAGPARPPGLPGPGAPPGPRSTPHLWLRRALGLGLAALVVAAIVTAVSVPRNGPGDDALPEQEARIAALVAGMPQRVTPGQIVRLDEAMLAVSLPGRAAVHDDRVLLVNTSTFRIDATLRTQPGPFALLAHPEAPELLLVSHLWSDGIEVWDWKQEVRLDVLGAPHYVTDLAASPDGAWLYAVSRDTGRMHVFDLRLQDTPRGVGVGGVTTLRLPAGDQLVSHPVSPGGSCLAVSPRGAVAVCGALAGRLDLFDVRPASNGTVSVSARSLQLGVPALSAVFAGEDLYVGTSQLAPDADAARGWEQVESGLLRVPPLGSEGNVDRWYADTTAEPVAVSRRVVAGALPAALAVEQDRMWVVYAATNQVQALELGQNLSVPGDPPRTASGRLSHLADETPLTIGNLSDAVYSVYETGPGPIAMARIGEFLVTLDGLSATLTFTDLSDCAGIAAPLAGCTGFAVALDRAPPFPSGMVEQGRAVFASALASNDQDKACASCHLGGDRDGLVHRLPWGEPAGPSQLRAEDTRSVLDLAPTAPYLSNGSLVRLRDYPGLDWMLAPSTGADNATAGLEMDNASLEAVWASLGLDPGADRRGVGDVLAAFLVAENSVPPNPRAGVEDPAVARGAASFSAGAECASCHMEPFASGPPSRAVLEGTSGPRDVASLNGLWRAEGALYADGSGPATVKEVLLPAGHSCLARGERGWALPEGHGAAANLECEGLEALIAYLLTL